MSRTPAVNLAGPDVRSYGTPFSASEGQHFGEDDQEETWRVIIYSFSLSSGQHYGKEDTGVARRRPR
jgi:hypothetical protein